MLVAYDSRTGNVERFIKKTGLEAVRLYEGLKLNEPYVLVTYTTGFGVVPPSTLKFLEHNKDYLMGVGISGNRNWGKNFGKAGFIISQSYGVPLILRFELSGTDLDVKKFKNEVKSLEVFRVKQHGNTAWG